MKKLFITLLALTMCLAMLACESKVDDTPSYVYSNTPSDVQDNSSQAQSAPSVKPLTINDITGTWNSSLWFFDSSIVINANTTYEHGLDKGTVAFLDETTFQLNPRYVDVAPVFKYHEGYIYQKNHCFDKDMDYGLSFSPDVNGRTDQTFNYAILNSKIDSSSGCNCIYLDLDSDGKYTLTTGTRTYSSFIKDKEYIGTYTYSDSILELYYNGRTYPLIVADGIIYFHVFEK